MARQTVQKKGENPNDPGRYVSEETSDDPQRDSRHEA